MNAAPPIAAFWLPCKTLWRREIVRFLRQRGRVVGALGTPLVFWVLMGAGLQKSLQPPGGGSMSYLEFSYPGAIAAIILFTAVFSMISLIEDRREGFMQGVLVAPVARCTVAMGKVLGASTLAVAQGLVFLVLAPVAGIHLSAGGALALAGSMALISFGLASLGFLIAWRMESTQGFHAIMNLVLMPMLILSGGFFPAAGSAGWLRAIMAMNPVTYDIGLLRWCLTFTHVPSLSPGPSLSLLVTLAFSFAMFAAAVIAVRKDSSRALT